MNRITTLFHHGIFICCFVFFTACQAQDNSPRSFVNGNKELSKLIESHKSTSGDLYIRIVKKDYVLSVMKGDVILKSYPVVFGSNPVDDKKQQGDGATPEGWFKVRSKYPHKSWSKFIWIDYPNDESRKRFAARKKSGEIPQSAAIGGEIGIHGVPEGYDHAIDEKMNWTLGCISMKNKDVNEIYPYLQEGSKIHIVLKL